MRVDIGNGTRLFFDVCGSGLEPATDEMAEKPTLLLLHGGPGNDHSLFRPWFDRFADTHQVVYLDHRGQGRSDDRQNPSGWNLDTWADDVVRFCDALDIREPVVVGHSFGGLVAMRYVARHPDHPARVVLSSTGARMHLGSMLDTFERLGGAEARQVATQLWNGQPTPEVMTAYAQRCIPLYSRSTERVNFGPRREWMNLRVLADWLTNENRTYDLRSDLARFACPTLVLGGVDDPVCPESAYHEIIDCLSTTDADITAELFTDCGHGSYRDRPDETARILRSWLA